MYYPQKFIRLAKVKLKAADRQKVLRMGMALLVFFAVLRVSPQQVPKTLGDEAGGSKIEAGQEARSSRPESSVQPPVSSPASSPQPQASVPMASISAQAVYAIDNETNTILLEKNANVRLPMASLTKIMTALVALKNFSLDEVVTVPKACADLPPSEMGLEPNEKINVEGLLYGMLVNSGSDAACALSHHLNGDFLALMNQKAAELGLSQTSFENEVGLDGENGSQLSSAKDLVKLSQEALKNGIFRKIVGTRQANIANANQSRWHSLISTNELLFTLPGTTGIKTGYTKQAKGCLAISYEREGHEIIAVILGSEDRFGDMQKILDWVFKAYSFP